MEKALIDGRNQLVFILRETEDRLVYIPVKNLHRVDYERLKKAEAEKSKRVDLLEHLKDKKSDNGRNMLELYDSIMQVCHKADKTHVRIHKPHESETAHEKQLREQKEAEDAKNNKPAEDPNGETVRVYEYEHNGKTKHWSGHGRMPVTIKAHVEDGGDMEDFAKEIQK